jgi:lipopolysaccharide transport system permease protein
MSRLLLWLATPFIHFPLSRNFIRQEIGGRFAGSMGGIFWSLLTPLANIFIYIFVFSTIMQIRLDIKDTGTEQFAVYLLAGLFPWMAFSEALARSTTLLLEKSNLITKVSFPVETLPYVGTAVPFILNGLGFGLFLLYLLAGGNGAWAWLWLPLAVLFHALFTLGLVALFAALSVFLRDLQQIMALAVQVWFYMTPILYPISMVPQPYQAWMAWNPAYPFIELYRQILLHHHLPLDLLLATSLIGGVTMLAGGWFFMRIKHAFGDVL